MNSNIQFQPRVIPYSNSQQNIPTLNSYNYLNQNINYPLGNLSNNIALSQQQKINPNSSLAATNNTLYQVPIINNPNTSLNTNVSTQKENIQNKSAVTQSSISNTKIIDIKRGKLSSSGSLLESTRSHKFNTVVKDGKKIRNIDINDDCQDTKNEDDTESIVSPNYPGKSLGKSNQLLQSGEEFANMPLDSDEIPN